MVATLQSIFDSIRGKKREAEKRVRSTWNQLVDDVASGKLKDPDDAAELMEKLGKTEADLTHAVELRKKRTNLAKQRADAVQADREIAQIEKRIDEANAKFEPIEAAHKQFVREQLYLAEVCQQKKRLGDEAEAELIRSCTDPETQAEIEPLQSRISELAQQEGSLRAMQRNLEEHVANAERQWDAHCRSGAINKILHEPRGAAPTMSASFPSEDWTSEIQGHLVSVRKKLADVVAEISANRAEMASLEGKITAIRRRFVDQA